MAKIVRPYGIIVRDFIGETFATYYSTQEEQQREFDRWISEGKSPFTITMVTVTETLHVGYE